MKDIKALVSILVVCLTVDGHPAQLGGGVGPGVGVQGSTLHKSVSQSASPAGVHHVAHGLLFGNHGHGNNHNHGRVSHGGRTPSRRVVGHGGNHGHGGQHTHGHHISHGSIGSSIGHGSSIGSVGLSHGSSIGSIGHGSSIGSVGSISSHGPIESVSSGYLPVEHVSHDVGHSSGGYGYDEYEKPDPFQFEYGVHDDHYHTDFSEHRSGDEAGNIYGEYQVALPDGRIQYVKYEADGHYGGTIMEVKYDGEARHPESYGGYHDSGYGYHAEHGVVAQPHAY